MTRQYVKVQREAVETYSPGEEAKGFRAADFILTHTGVIFADSSEGGPKVLREPSHIMPADLANCYDVEPPPPRTAKDA